ncbi:hypothetical protein ACHAWO_001359 [Cyclotella atomus]|uniref:C3H1-type domain-containing protein n=1 Tax=Cyclotella atomus TaxID=382360 RepID=A0ABD3NU07_9STRA
MSGPSVWNGRNEKILGPSNDSNTSINTLPASNVDPAKASSDVAANSANNVKAAPTPAPVPSRSVWNGKHDVIKAMATPAPATVAVPAPSSTNINAADTSTNNSASKSKNVTAKKKKGANSNSTTSHVVVNANTKNPNKVVLPATLAKDAVAPVADEGTNSTAGSSTTNTIEEEASDHNAKGSSTSSGRSIESSEDGRHNNVVVSVPSPSNTSSLDTEDDGGGVVVVAKEEKAKNAHVKNTASEASSDAPPVVSVGEKKKKERSQSSGNMSNSGGKGQQKNKGGRQQQGTNNNNGSGQSNGQHRSGNSKQQQYGHRGSNGNNGRRKANNSGSIQNGDKPVCAFFVRGMCNRGTACAFKHDPSIIAPAPPSSRGYQGNNQMMLRNGTPNQQTIVPATPSFHRLGSGGSGRVFDPLKARAIQLAKDAQDKEDRSIFASPTHPELAKDATSTVVVAAEPPFFSIDVECIATGYGSCAKGINDGCGNEGKNAEGVPPSQYNELSQRYPGRVAVVDSEGNLLADVVIRPPKDGAGVVSYLTPLTGLTNEKCLGPEAKSLEEAVSLVKSLLPKDGVLVGQAIDHDVEWLGLTPGKDFERMVDLSVIFRQRVPAVLGKASDVLRNAAETGAAIGNKDAHPSSDESLGFDTRYRSFSLRHVCLNLLGTDIQSGVHDPIVDARYSLILFHKYRNASVTQLRIVRDGLHRAPVTPGFAAEKTPVLDGVCVSAAGFPYKRAARKIWRWYSGKKGQQTNSCS